MSDSWKEITRATYNAVAEGYAYRDTQEIDETEEHRSAAAMFCKLIPAGGRILDVGCAAGRDARYFHDRGFEVTGIDFSERMIEEARSVNPAIEFEVMDFEALRLDRTFDGIWAAASLHHLPKKNLPGVLQNLYRLLKPGGQFFVKVKHGDRDGMRSNEKFGITANRYFAFYEVPELETALQDSNFTVSSIRTVTDDEWIDALCTK